VTTLRAVSSLPQSSELTVRVRFVETDLMGIVHHSNYLAYFEAARVDFLHKRGVSYEAWLKEGVHLAVVEANVQYKRAARFDDLLAVEATCAELSRVTVRFTYRVQRGDKIIAVGSTLLACLGDNLNPKRIPENIANVLRSPELPSAVPR